MAKAQHSIQVRQLFDRESCSYTYLVYDPISKQGALIDCVQEQIERDLKLLDELGIELIYLLETHAHADHITAAGQLRQRTGAKIGYGQAAGIAGIDLSLADGDCLPLGSSTIKVLATPGHTSGCISYYLEQDENNSAVFTGDALLIRGCGRTDFQQGSTEALYQSIQQKLFTLAEHTLVYPGHDYNGRTVSSIGEEIQWNPRVGQNKRLEDFVEIMANLNLAVPKKINEAVPANNHCGINFDPNRYLQSEFTMEQLHKVWQQNKETILIVDNRSPEEFSQGHVPGSKNIPLGEENKYLDELNRYEQVYMYCHSGRRSQTAMINLSLLGLSHISCASHSGFPQWQAADFQVEIGEQSVT
jgi:glyoxylase-like metal-dependent hydrolase (beta-lactamase superfamily II)/rhodanese-related sulfurtransferase